MPVAQTNAPYPLKQTGVGLIEVLIAALVLSIGFLGIAALQARALANNSSAMMRTQAAIAGYSILDAMRADRASAGAGAYNTTATYGLDGSGDPQCTLSSALTGLANNQVQAWCLGSNSIPPDGLASLGVNAAGVGASGRISCDNDGECTITISFDDARGSGGSNAQTLTVKTML
jgi:type IV pilus assembly protein PilV